MLGKSVLNKAVPMRNFRDTQTTAWPQPVAIWGAGLIQTNVVVPLPRPRWLLAWPRPLLCLPPSLVGAPVDLSSFYLPVSFSEIELPI